MSTSSTPQTDAQPGEDIVFKISDVKVVSSTGTTLLQDGTGVYNGGIGLKNIRCEKFTNLPKVGEHYTISADNLPGTPNWKCVASGATSSFNQQQTN